MIAALALALLAPQEATPLEAGVPARGTLGADAPSAAAPELVDAAGAPHPNRSARYVFACPATGPYTFSLHSFDFDAYLVVREVEGDGIWEDDDGGLGTHAELVVELMEGRTYAIDACGLGEGAGDFTLLGSAGRPVERSPAEKARAEFDEAGRQAEHDRERFGEGSKEHGRSLHELALLAYQQARYDEAIAIFESLLPYEIALFGADSEQVDTLHSNLGFACQGAGRYTDAARHAREAIRIIGAREGEDSPELVVPLAGLIGTLQRLRELEEAEAVGRRAIALADATIGRETNPSGVARVNLAGVLADRGKASEARRLYEDAIAIHEVVHGASSPSTALAMRNLAVLLAENGLHAEATRLLERAHRIFEDTLGAEHPATASTALNLGTVLSMDLAFEEALPLMEAGIEGRRAALGPDHPEVGISWRSLAVAYVKVGRFEEGARAFEEASRILTASLGEEHPHTVRLRIERAGLDLRADRPEAARAALEPLAPLVERSRELDASLAPDFFRELSLARNLAGDQEGAFDAAELRHRALLERTSAGQAALSEGERLTTLAESEGALHLLLRLASRNREDLDAPGVRERRRDEVLRAYGAALEWKGAIGRQLATSRERLFEELGREGRQRVERLRALQRALSSSTLGGAALPQERLEELARDRHRLERELRATPEAWSDHAPTLEEVHAGLDERSAFVDFLLLKSWTYLSETQSWNEDETLYVWVLRPGSAGARLIRIYEVEPIRAATDKLLEALAGRRGGASLGSDASEPAWRAPADELRALLWERIESALGDPPRAILCPDGFLAGLPFDLLPDGDGGFLLESIELAYVDDASALLRPAATEPAPPSLLAVGGVDFRRRAESESSEALEPAAASSTRSGFRERWRRLPGTSAEAAAVLDLHDEAFDGDAARTELTGADATEEALKEAMPRHDVLHLATHGFFRPEGVPSMWERVRNAGGEIEVRLGEDAARLLEVHPGLLSGLVCAGANAAAPSGRDDGYLTAEEVAWLDLRAVRLVVLSACETALGRAAAGEGLLGLRRAFRLAGADAVVSSLWEVDDQATRELMEDFYARMWLDGDSAATAFRNARLAMLDRNRIEEGDPLPTTWGAFVLSGAWR